MSIWLLAACAYAYTLQTTEAGAVTHWRAMPVAWSLDTADAPRSLDPGEIARAVEAAAATWERVPGAAVTFDGHVGEGLPESSNQIRFARDWPWDDDLAAMTLTTHEIGSGAIVAFSLLVNAERDWADIDVQSVIAHELGHVLGIEHSAVEDAVMYAVLQAGVVRREPHEDDQEAARSLYPAPSDGEEAPLRCDAGGLGPMALWFLAVPALRRRARR